MKQIKKTLIFVAGRLLLILIAAISVSFWNKVSAEENPQTEMSYQLDLNASSREQNEDNSSDPIDPYISFHEEGGWSAKLWGKPFDNRLLLGMWTHHFESGDDQENNNELLGMVYNGYYVGTFINTHSDRVVSAGWQRKLYSLSSGEWSVEAGYRAGVMYGYKKYLRAFDTDFFPLFQTLLDVSYKNVGLELSWAGVVMTAGFYFKI
ncbi:hypothetical protein EOPP23_01755 [Endozoicomonas sp. OPT23]|uniref:hypothetical protein n=1 Tax=Endozoicomonas sp. OPT23 TaxID=2072845 RepID=UPI00129AE5A5|nr:hypothetical protein [Endozoicomonas sp. OPT23]MRI31720.1 hypothetical protein [Endozoicomonas sp. OPT23]